MKKWIGVLVSAFAVVLLGTSVGVHQLLAAQVATPAASQMGLVGAWQLHVTSSAGMRPWPALATFGADGSMLVGDIPVQPIAPSTIAYFSPGHGVWRDGSPAAYTFAEVAAQGNGTVIGTNVIRGTVMLGAGGQTLSGPFTFKAVNPNGTPVAQGSGTITGTRIVVLP